MVKKAVRVYIHGIVQGVFFRKFVKEKAEELGIKGYVRNKEDGSVEAWFEGSGGRVDKMIEKCKNGPEHAVVKRLDTIEEKFEGRDKFKILRF
jgi:acylphosphatase